MARPQPRFVVLGASGFVGSALAAQLRESGEVAGRNSSALDLASPESPERLSADLDENTILVIATRARRSADPLADLSMEVAMAANVARCLLRKRARKCVYLSSLAVYGESATNLSITEATAVAPDSFYAISKFAGECAIRTAAEEGGIPLLVLRPCMIYGPGDTTAAYGPGRLVREIAREGKARIFGDGAERRDFLFIRDLARIVQRLALGSPRGVYNVCTGENHSFREILDRLREISGKECEIIHLERKRPMTDQKTNPARLLADLPGFSFTPFEEGLAETFRRFSEPREKV